MNDTLPFLTPPQSYKSCGLCIFTVKWCGPLFIKTTKRCSQWLSLSVREEHKGVGITSVQNACELLISKNFRRSNSIFSVMFRCWVSEETMYMCKTFATISTKGKYVFFIQYCSWWLWYPLVAVLYLMVKASQLKASVCYKQQNVSWYMVVYHIVIVLYMPMDSHMTWGNSINWEGNFVLVFSSVFWIDLKSETELVINVSGLYAHKH